MHAYLVFRQWSIKKESGIVLVFRLFVYLTWKFKEEIGFVCNNIAHCREWLSLLKFLETVPLRLFRSEKLLKVDEKPSNEKF